MIVFKFIDTLKQRKYNDFITIESWVNLWKTTLKELLDCYLGYFFTH